MVYRDRPDRRIPHEAIDSRRAELQQQQQQESGYDSPTWGQVLEEFGAIASRGANRVPAGIYRAATNTQSNAIGQ
eukprot:11705632-Alexandrium_andersonii.AAC.1